MKTSQESYQKIAQSKMILNRFIQCKSQGRIPTGQQYQYSENQLKKVKSVGKVRPFSSDRYGATSPRYLSDQQKGQIKQKTVRKFVNQTKKLITKQNDARDQNEQIRKEMYDTRTAGFKYEAPQERPKSYLQLKEIQTQLHTARNQNTHSLLDPRKYATPQLRQSPERSNLDLNEVDQKINNMLEGKSEQKNYNYSERSASRPHAPVINIYPNDNFGQQIIKVQTCVPPVKQSNKQKDQEITSLKQKLDNAQTEVRKLRVVSAQRTAHLRGEYTTARHVHEDQAMTIYRLEEQLQNQEEKYNRKLDEIETKNFNLQKTSILLKQEMTNQQRQMQTQDLQVVEQEEKLDLQNKKMNHQSIQIELQRQELRTQEYKFKQLLDEKAMYQKLENYKYTPKRTIGIQTYIPKKKGTETGYKEQTQRCFSSPMSDTSIRFSEATTQNIAMESTNIELRDTKDSNKMHQSQHDSDVNTTYQASNARFEQRTVNHIYPPSVNSSGVITINHTRRSRQDRNGNNSSTTIIIQSPQKNYSTQNFGPRKNQQNMEILPEEDNDTSDDNIDSLQIESERHNFLNESINALKQTKIPNQLSKLRKSKHPAKKLKKNLNKNKSEIYSAPENNADEDRVAKTARSRVGKSKTKQLSRLRVEKKYSKIKFTPIVRGDDSMHHERFKKQYLSIERGSRQKRQTPLLSENNIDELLHQPFLHKKNLQSQNQNDLLTIGSFHKIFGNVQISSDIEML